MKKRLQKSLLPLLTLVLTGGMLFSAGEAFAQSYAGVDTVYYRGMVKYLSPKNRLDLPAQMRFFEATNSAGNEYVGWRAPFNMPASYTLIWPVNAPSSFPAILQAVSADSTTWGTTGSGDITGVIAGVGLADGGLSGDVTLNVIYAATAGNADTLTLHDFITGTPSANTFIKWNGANWVTAAAGGTIIGREVDGLPSIAALSTLEFLQSTGLKFTDQGSNVGRVEIDTSTVWINTKTEIAAQIASAIAAYQQDSDTTGFDASKTWVLAKNYLTAETGDISAVTAGYGLAGGGSSGAVTLTVDSTTVYLQTKTENNALYVPLARMLTAGNGLVGGGDLAANRTLDVIGSDGLKAEADTLRAILTSTAGILIKAGVGVIDSLELKLDGSTLSKSTAGVKVSAIGSAEITNGAILNEDINASAAIALSKLASSNAGRLVITSGGTLAERAALTPSALAVGDASNGVASLALGAANRVVGMNSGATANEYKDVLGTSNRVTVTHGANSITLNTPQDLHTAALNQFGRTLLDSLRFTNTGGIWQNSDTLRFLRKSDGLFQFKLDLGDLPATGEFMRVAAGRIVNFGAIADADVPNTITLDNVTQITTRALSDMQGQVGDLQIADGAVDGGTGGEVADNTLTADDIATDAIGALELAANAADSGNVIQLGISAGDINDAAILNAKLANKAVTYAKIQDISLTQRVLGRNSSGAGVTEEVTVSQVLDWISSTRGTVLYRGASGWSALSPGTSGQVLHTQGAGADPIWDADDGAGGGAPSDVDYLVGTASGSLSAEIVVGTSPGGELGGTWASPTIDADAVLWNEIGDAGGDATIASGAHETDFTSSIDAAGEAVFTITNTDADAANANSILILAHNDGADADVTYLKMTSDADGTPANDFVFDQVSFTSLLPVNVPAEAYDATGWNSDTGAPQKDAVRDKIESLALTNDDLSDNSINDLNDVTIASAAAGHLLVRNAGNTAFENVALSGDGSISAVGALTVTNDSHDHTTTTISGLDVSSDLNLVAGTNITLTGDQLDVDDAFVLNTGDAITGNLDFNDGVTDSPQAIFTPATGTAWKFYTVDSDDDLAIESASSASTENIDITNPGAGTATLTVEGTIGASNFSGSSSGTNTGDQTITLTSHVTGSGTGSFATTIANSVITAAMIANGDHGAFTYASNVAALDAGTVNGGNAGVISDNTITADDVAADAIGASELLESADFTFTGSATFDGDALHIFDTDASHDLIITPGSNLTADHTLTLTTGDADRTLTISGNTTLGGGSHSGTNTGDQTITLTTDVTGSGTGSFATTIANDAVTNAKAANMAQNTLKMRVASGSGDPEDIDISAGLTLVTAASGDMIIVEDATDGNLKRVDAADFIGAASGDITAVGDATSGSVFTGTSGTQLIFNNGSNDLTLSIGSTTAARAVTFGDFAGEITVLGNTTTGTGAQVREGSPTITTPSIADQSNMNHTHQSVAGGGYFVGNSFIRAQNNSDAASNQVAQFQAGDRVTAADNDEGYFSFYNDNDGGTQTEFSRLSWLATDVTAATKDGAFTFDIMSANTLTEVFRIQSSAGGTITTEVVTGTFVLPTPFTLGGVSVTPTGTELNFVDGVTSAIQTQIDGKQASDADLTDLADGSLTGTKVGFADTDNNWTATDVQTALEELDDVIGGGVPNQATGKVDWSQLVNVPAGFADNSDDGGGGATAWDAIGDPSGDGTVAFAGTSQIITGNTNDVTAIAQDLLALNYTNDGATDILTQRILVLNKLAASTNALERALVIDNQDGAALDVALEIVGTSTGAVTTAIKADDAEIGTALAIGSNDITTTSTTIASTELDRLDGLTAAIVQADRSITINGTASEITSSAGAQDLSANRTWTLSLPDVYAIVDIHAGAFFTGAGDLTGTIFGTDADNTNDFSADYLEFSASADNYISVVVNMPPDWDASTAPKFKIISYSTGSHASQTAAWDIACGYVRPGTDSWIAALGSAVEATQTYTSANVWQLSSALAPTPAGTAAAGAQIKVRLFREGTDGTNDTFTSTSRLVKLQMQYKKTVYGDTVSW